MEAKKFKLFIGYFGNGATVCNSAVYEHGDYKTIAHISPAGNIKIYVTADYIPPEAMQKILRVAERHATETRARLERETATDYGYYKTLDAIGNYTPYTVSDALFETLKSCGSDAERRAAVIACYMQNF